MGGQVTKRCHWVPQAYLRGFAADAGRQRIWRFSKNEGGPELKRIDKVAVRHHLYSPMKADGVGRDDALEKKLADLESFFGDPVWRAVSTDFVDLSWGALRKMVALQTAVMWLRTPRQFEFWQNLHREFIDFFSKGPLPDETVIGDRTVPLDKLTWPAYRDATTEDMKRAWNEALGQSADIAKLFLDMRWSIIVSDAPVFITSDNPVMVGDTIGPHKGLRHPDAMVTFPISPTRVLCMDNRHSEPANQYYPLKYDPASMNGLIWRNAMEYMFSPRNPDDVCREMVAEADRMGIA